MELLISIYTKMEIINGPWNLLVQVILMLNIQIGRVMKYLQRYTIKLDRRYDMGNYIC